MAPSLTHARRPLGRAVRLLSAAVLVTVALSLTAAGALGAGGRLQLYLVNSGPATDFYPLAGAIPADCDANFQKPASLSTSHGRSVQYDSPGYAFTTDPLDAIPSTFSYTVPAGAGFTVPASPDAVVLKLWALSGGGTCPGQLNNQTVDWRVLCSGTCGSDVSLTGAGQAAPKAGWQALGVPAGTPVNSLFNVHAGPPSKVKVGAGDVITLELSADTWVGIQWSAPTGAGVSSLSILGS
jgi:hypothetical protein